MTSFIASTLRKALLTSALVMGVALAPALAEKTYDFPKEKPIFTISYPDSWTEIYYDEEYVEYGVKEDISVAAWILKDRKDAKEAAAEAAAEVIKYVKDFKAKEGDPATIKVNGMDMILIEGSGKDSKTGKDVLVQIGFFLPDGKTVCAVLYNCDKDKMATYDADVVKIVRSVKAK